jgi:glycosyltransferase involved in cell wall biosynthesis
MEKIINPDCFIKISIIVPVYNTSRYLRQCLDSIICQTFKSIEIICINDASSDNSLEILEEYSKKDNRIKVINLQQNRGLGAVRNIGLSVAQGEYIGFVDSDDWIETNMYEKLVEASLDRGNVDLVTSSKIYQNNKDNRKIIDHISLQLSYSSKEEINRYVCKNLSAALWMNIIKRELFFNNALFFAEDLMHEDVPIAHALYCSASSIAIVDMPFYHYRVNMQSLTNAAKDNRFDLLTTCVMYLENMKRLGFYNLYRDECDFWFYTRYYCRMISTCFMVFPTIRKDYIRKIKNNFSKYVDIYKNKYYLSRKKTKFDYFLYIVNANTNFSCFIYKLFVLLKKITNYLKSINMY